MSRESFLNRVRKAAHAGRSYRLSIHEPEQGCGYIGAGGDDLCLSFAKEVEAVGGVIDLATTWEQAQEHLVRLLQQYSAKLALCWRHEMLEQVGLSALLEQRDIEQLDYSSLTDMNPANADLSAIRERMLAADVGVSSADLAIAETGSLLLCSGPGKERVSSLLPPVHIALVHERQIVADLFDALSYLENPGRLGRKRPGRLGRKRPGRLGRKRPGRLGRKRPGPTGDWASQPSNAVFITGPSKTGDIELQLTTGVHGPGKWHVIVVRC